MRRPLRGVTVALAASAVLLSGCSGDDRSRQVDGAVIQPGKPGEKAEVLDEAPEIERARANDADVEFVQMMIPHHAQALQMAQLAPDARGSKAVRTMADRIDGAQRPEIVFMAGWLTDQGLDAPTKEQIEGGNIPIQGAIEMVDTVVREGADLQVNELATSIAADQTAEIDRMRQLLADL